MIESFLTIYFLTSLSSNSNLILEENPKELSHMEQVLNMQSPFSKNPYYIAPVLESKAVLAIDRNTNKILYQKNANLKRQIASLTKLMTAYIILEENKLEETVTISRKAVDAFGSKVWLFPNEKITVQSLLYGLLVHSGNDAAVALAEHNADTVESFIDKMNIYAKNLGLTNTHFSNPSGLDDPENYSTAFDLSILTQQILKFPLVLEIVKNKNFVITSADGKLKHKLKTTNELLDSYLPIKGLKTGTTDLAKECFIGITENKNNGDIITIILGSPNRFQETKILIDWISRAFNW